MFALKEKWLDPSQKYSLAWRLRARRFEVFRQWLAQFPRPLKILDVGGTMLYWKTMGFDNPKDIHIVLLNLEAGPTDSPAFTSVAGDATDMPQFRDKEFDIVFSNSVIEHVGSDAQQARMAREIMRVGKAWFIQTPNLYFPIESHFYFPFFQFMPVPLRALLLYYFDITGGGIRGTIDAWKKRLKFQRVERPPGQWESCVRRVKNVRLLHKKKFHALFPDSNLYREKSLGLTKSFIVYTPVEASSVVRLPRRQRSEFEAG